MKQERESLEWSDPNQRAIILANRTLLALLVLVCLTTVFLTATREALTLPGASEPLPQLCYSQRNFGVPCRSCGLTRSTVLVLQGKWTTAHELHRGGFWVAGFLVSQLLLRLIGSFRRFAHFWPWDLAVTLVLIVVCLTR